MITVAFVEISKEMTVLLSRLNRVFGTLAGLRRVETVNFHPCNIPRNTTFTSQVSLKATSTKNKMVSTNRNTNTCCNKWSYVIDFFLQSLSPKLTADERTKTLNPLLHTGWSIVDKRDAIYKEFVFKNFNEVSYNFFLVVVVKSFCL